MKYYESTALIDASPGAVWAVLIDVANYPNWDSGVVRVEGSVAPGAKIKVVSSVNPKRAFPVTVTELASQRRDGVERRDAARTVQGSTDVFAGS